MQDTIGLRQGSGSLRAFLLAAIAVGLVLRFVSLGGQSLWVDEMLTLSNAHIGRDLNASHIFGNFQGPLVSLLMHAWASVSSNEAYLRIPFAVAGAFTVIAGFFLARHASGFWTALNTTFFLALSPVLLWYSQEIRGYVFVLLFTVLMTYFLLRWADRREGKSLIWYGVFTFAALVSNLSAAFILAAHFLYLVLVPARRRLAGKWIVTILVVLMVFSPWVRQVLVKVPPASAAAGETSQPMRGGAPLTVMAPPYSFFVYSVGYSLGPSVRDLQTRSAEAVRENVHWILLTLIVFAIPFAAGLRRLAMEDRGLLVLLLLSVGIPLLAVSALSAANIKVFTPRYALVCFPAYALIIGRGLADISRGRLKFVIFVFAALLGISLFNHFLVPGYAKDDAREAARVISENLEQGDTVVGFAVAAPLQHYLGDISPVQVFEARDIESAEAMEARCAGIAGGAGRVWLSLCREWIIDPDGHIESWFEANMIPVSSFRFPGVRLYLYEKGSG
ncbi:glycosyltransferase family 39 protein [Candidatus Eisenbacteria bacterium]|uniref:Glycosyltransferase family 39 protein n=1 Tax=Eiseniibacteriota bacterium TaxID=2212470 RepID=A0ABV6YPK5_UNCEI